MTHELKKAIEIVKAYLDMDSDVDSEYLNAQRTIIQALETQPTDADCISRQVVLEKAINVPIAKVVTEDKMICRKIVFIEDIQKLPPVTPKGVTITDFADRCRECGREKVLDKIIAEILDEAEYAYADFDRYKDDILHADSDELPDDDFRYGMERAVEIINKYITESGQR